MRVAKSYEGYSFDETKAYKKNGKIYVTATCKCDRCVNGIYVCRVENGQPIPHPAYGGVCLRCGGTGILRKEIRLYTDKEYEQMEKTKAKTAEKKAIEQEQKMKAEYEEKKQEWLEKNGFNENLTTFVYFPADSFEVKDKLKEAGFKFNNSLLWHAAAVPQGYEESCVEIHLDEVVELCAWGTGNYKPTARTTVEEILKAARPASKSQWIGEEKEKLTDLPVTLVSIHGFEGRYGYSQVVKFHNGDNILTWFTATHIDAEPGDSLLLSGTIKSHDTYDGEAITIMTRCKLKAV